MKKRLAVIVRFVGIAIGLPLFFAAAAFEEGKIFLFSGCFLLPGLIGIWYLDSISKSSDDQNN